MSEMVLGFAVRYVLLMLFPKLEVLLMKLMSSIVRVKSNMVAGEVVLGVPPFSRMKYPILGVLIEFCNVKPAGLREDILTISENTKVSTPVLTLR